MKYSTFNNTFQNLFAHSQASLIGADESRNHGFEADRSQTGCSCQVFVFAVTGSLHDRHISPPKLSVELTSQSGMTVHLFSSCSSLNVT